jgi:26S proteasome regulatory subunit N2
VSAEGRSLNHDGCLDSLSLTLAAILSLCVSAKAIDQYIETTSDVKASSPDPRLAAIVEQMFSRCVADKDYRQALGIALETRRLDVIEGILTSTKDQARNQVLHLLVKVFKALPVPDHFGISQCYVFLNAPELASDLFIELVDKAHNGASASATANTENDPLLIAYQIAFDLAESATQEFLESVRKLLQEKGGEANQGTVAKVEDTAMNGGEKESSTMATCIDRIRSILLGEESIQLYLDFLQGSNQADLTILKATKEALDARSSIYHNAMTFANAFMNAGTTSDKFLRENLDWLAKASNWGKFTATAALGVINKGNLKEGISILRPYLPHDGVSSSVYSEGGSLYALGLIMEPKSWNFSKTHSRATQQKLFSMELHWVWVQQEWQVATKKCMMNFETFSIPILPLLVKLVVMPWD